MLEYTKIELPMEIRAAGDNVLLGTAQGILLVVVHGKDDVLRTVEIAHSDSDRLKGELIF